MPVIFPMDTHQKLSVELFSTAKYPPELYLSSSLKSKHDFEEKKLTEKLRLLFQERNFVKKTVEIEQKIFFMNKVLQGRRMLKYGNNNYPINKKYSPKSLVDGIFYGKTVLYNDDSNSHKKERPYFIFSKESSIDDDCLERICSTLPIHLQTIIDKKRKEIQFSKLHKREIVVQAHRIKSSRKIQENQQWINLIRSLDLLNL